MKGVGQTLGQVRTAWDKAKCDALRAQDAQEELQVIADRLSAADLERFIAEDVARLTRA